VEFPWRGEDGCKWYPAEDTADRLAAIEARLDALEAAWSRRHEP
jgi:hypothetical protein